MPSKGQFTDMRARLERHIEPCPTTGCWLFTGKGDKDGYGSLRNRYGSGGDFKAHRIAWQVYRGTIPDGLDVAHHCDVRCCVNPNHLYTATRTQNLADRTARMREPRGEQCSWAKLSSADVRNIRADSRPAKIVACEYGITWQSVYAIRSRKTWTHLND